MISMGDSMRAVVGFFPLLNPLCVLVLVPDRVQLGRLHKIALVGKLTCWTLEWPHPPFGRLVNFLDSMKPFEVQ